MSASNTFTISLPQQFNNNFPSDHEYLNSEASLIKRCFDNAIGMMTIRGYTIPPPFDQIVDLSIGEFVNYFLTRALTHNTTFEEQINILFVAPISDTYVRDTTTMLTLDDNTQIEMSRPGVLDNVWLTFANSREGTSLSKERFEQIRKDTPPDIRHDIIVSQRSPSSHVINGVQKMPRRFEFFTYTDLTIDPSKHFLNSKFILLSPEAKQKLIDELKETNSTLKEIAKMSYQERMARMYGANPGDVFEILRYNIGVDMIIDYDISWRLVVPTPLPKIKINIPS